MENALEKRVAFLEKELAAAKADIEDFKSAFSRYIDMCSNDYRELHTYAYKAFCKTHPEYCASMDQFHDIIVKGKQPPGDDKAN